MYFISKQYFVKNNQTITASPSDSSAVLSTDRPSLIVYDRSLKAVGLLDNAYNVGVDRRVNELWTASFSLPADDTKAELCTHFNYVDVVGPSGRKYGLYRIIPTRTKKRQGYVTYELEHVLATLLDDIIDGYVQYTNLTTDVVLRNILSLQEAKHWRLGDVDITRYFHYKFENENGLLAPILSVPKPFDEPYEFTFDTESYPWTLNLTRPVNDAQAEIRWGKDMLDFDRFSDPTSIINHIIPKGAGEGVNQLTIADVNNGRRYLEDTASIARWGKQSYIWIDRRFEDAESLKASAQSMLDERKDPEISVEIDAVDLSIKPEYAGTRRMLNAVTNIIVEDDDYKARITGEVIKDLAREWDVKYVLNNRIDDISSSQADIERKQQVNDAYSQGSTNIMTFGYQDNCDANIPAVIPFYVDDDVVNVNTVELTFRTRRFRAYSEATGGGGGIVGTTKSGGGTTATSSSGGGTSTTSGSGGGTSTTSGSGGGTSRSTAGGGGATRTASRTGAHVHPIPAPGTGGTGTTGSAGTHDHTVSLPSHTHEFSTPNHSHSISLSNHTHSITISPHTHSVTVPNHSHEIELPNHTHNVLHKIVELSSTPSRVTIKVDGNTVPHTSTSGDRINLVDYLRKDSNGKIARGRHEVEILPAGLARIEADLTLRVFIQSHLGQVY